MTAVKTARVVTSDPRLNCGLRLAVRASQFVTGSCKETAWSYNGKIGKNARSRKEISGRRVDLFNGCDEILLLGFALVMIRK